MRPPRFLFGLLTLLLMAIAPAGLAMAASMCAMTQTGEAIVMPMQDDGNESAKKGAGDCAFLCAQLCQMVPCAATLPSVGRTERPVTFAISPRFTLLPTAGPEPPPPRALS
jgi:hypothetical protein